MVKGKDWKGGLYQKTKVTVGNPVNEGEDIKVIMTERDDQEMRMGVQSIYAAGSLSSGS